MNEIEKVSKQELAWNNKPVLSSDVEIVQILAPMFASFPQTKADKNTVENYVTMLRDIAPDKLRAAILEVKATCKFFPTIAEIREAAGANMKRAPGPWSDVDPDKLPPLRGTFHRLPEDEDKKQRLARMAATKGWGERYA